MALSHWSLGSRQSAVSHGWASFAVRFLIVLDGIQNGIRLGPLEGSVELRSEPVLEWLFSQGPGDTAMGDHARGGQEGPESGSVLCATIRPVQELPVNFVAKKHLANVRLIHNLSHPFSANSVNALISPDEAAVQYQRFEDYRYV